MFIKEAQIFNVKAISVNHKRGPRNQQKSRVFSNRLYWCGDTRYDTVAAVRKVHTT